MMDGQIHRIGDAPVRREDERFIQGAGRYLDDLVFDDLCHAAFVRSPYAHAEIERIDVAAVLAMPGVLTVLTGNDATADGLKPLTPFVAANTVTGEPFAHDNQPLLATGKIRFPGETVVIVVAETKAAALDAAEAVSVDYRELPAVTRGLAALEVGAPKVSPDVPGNLCFDWRTGDADRAAAAMTSAAHVAEIDILNHRLVTHPIEPRGGVGVFEAETGRYVLHVSSQNIHGNRDFIAVALGVSRDDVRWIAPDVGGGFGAKNFAYPEQALLLWTAKRLGRPVKWIASRSEVFLADHQSRDHEATARLALDADGRFLALEIDSVANLGGYMAGSAGAVQTYQYVHLPGTVYDVGAVAMRVRAALSNVAPLGVMRGPGFAEMVNIVERLIDRAADVSGIDRFELRRRNLLAPGAIPRTNSFGNTIDSGNFPAAFERALALAGVDSGNSSAGPIYTGVGVACHIKATGGSPDENAHVRFTADGGVDLVMGTQHIGQGHETTFPQLLAEKIGIPNHLIRLVQGDTDAIPFGGGHGSSRATYMGGTAIFRAADEAVAKGAPIAAEMLQAPADQVAFADGRYSTGDGARSVDILAVAAEAQARNMPLDAYHFWTREHMTYPNGTHVAVVEVDSDTGVVRLVRYVAVDDYGVVVNPMVAHGQVHGAIAQGVGQALLEEIVADPSTGQILTGSFMDYAMPRADDLPSFEVEFSPVPCTTNPLGVKGCGEAGAIAGYPAITLAILDALKPLGIKGWDGAARPETIWRAIQAAG